MTRAETIHFAATLYRLAGAENVDIILFRELYRSRAAEAVGVALEQLFHSTLANWHRQGRVHRADQPGKFPGDWLGANSVVFDHSAIMERAQAICQAAVSADIGFLEYTPHRLTLRLSGEAPRTYLNSAAALADPAQLGALPALAGHTHGWVAGDTVVVDRNGHTWLIDFAQAAVAPLLRDYVSLESAITLDLLDTTDLHDCFMFEQRLLALNRLGDPIPDGDLPANLQYALGVVERLRSLAAEIPRADLATYHAGLLAFALRRVATYDPKRRYPRRELLPYVHALLATAMLTDKLLVPAHDLDQLPPEAHTGFWLDSTNKVAWVEGRRVDLTRQEFKILEYLNEHAGEVRSHEQIVTGALRDEVEDPVLEAGRLTSAMTRLRKKIEAPDTKQPRYIKTVHGHGYVLER